VGTGTSLYEESCAEVIDVFWCPLGESYLFGDEDETESKLTEAASGKRVSA
jgi:hypothetical protein